MSKNIVFRYVLAIIALLVIGMLLFSTPLFTQTGGKKLLIHMRTNIKKDDGPPCVGFNMALAGLKAGYQVEMLFDIEAAYNIKIFTDSKTDYERYTVPADLKALVKEQYPDFPMDKVKTYQDFLSVYHQLGVKITVNGTWNALTQVEKTVKGKEHIIPIAEPLSLKEMAAHIATADVYVAY
ncbi:MAG: hypothetical protein ONB46_15190 [candidate division KSB1 bacterium]|nr:hypothetical protein [candidate division KSB1 bacterium]MDZ7367062.1 hypothetical protein [candidate division KSB1 bacterium]MDZ7405041.1 hypothetical protein [candidate division KSB1 bacterium]